MITLVIAWVIVLSPILALILFSEGFRLAVAVFSVVALYTWAVGHVFAWIAS